MNFEQYKFLKKQLLQKADENRPIAKQPQPAPLVLAYIGDAIFSLYVRERLYLLEKNKVRVLNDTGAALVSAVMQAQAIDHLQSELTEAETDMVRRGRNTKSSVPKSASVSEYRKSTGFECLVGWLHWLEEKERLDFLLDKAFAFLIKQLLIKENGDVS